MRKIFFVFVFFVFAYSATAQTFEARVNRSSVPEGETFLLTLELNGAKTNQTPNFSPLDIDFTTYSIAQSHRTNIVNGNVSQSQQWNLVLMPNKIGKIVIPAIELDKYKTTPIEIYVGEQNAKDISDQSQIKPVRFKINGSIDNTKPYVQQQINYTLTLYDAGGLQGDAPFFVNNDENNWIIKSLGEPQIQTKLDNGKTYREITFKYALFAQKSGEIEIPPVRFNGFYLTKDQRTDPFANLFADSAFSGGFGFSDVFATRNPVILNTKPIKVNVQPAPAENGRDWWLPAENVKLYAEFVSQPPRFKVGDAVSRNIYLQATGVIDSQLPDITFSATPNLKQYPEKPQFEAKLQNGKIIATKKITNVYIPTKAGELILPEISVDWFNTKTKTMETATLPEMKVLVAENPNMQKNNNQPSAIAKQENNFIESQNNQPPKPVIPETSVWKMNILAFGLGIIICLIIIKLVSLARSIKSGYSKQVISAAKNRDFRTLRDAILAWAQNKWPDKKIISLQDVDEIVENKEFRCELDKLSEVLYSQNEKEWNEFLFIKTFKKINKKHRKIGKYNEPLPKLYK
ncbi:MAG: protein BatD [Alphaproteobacteria bacterium]|nr:protein BatD [Alphaproteobacteria bacterium]